MSRWQIVSLQASEGSVNSLECVHNLAEILWQVWSQRQEMMSCLLAGGSLQAFYIQCNAEPSADVYDHAPSKYENSAVCMLNMILCMGLLCGVLNQYCSGRFFYVCMWMHACFTRLIWLLHIQMTCMLYSRRTCHWRDSSVVWPQSRSVSACLCRSSWTERRCCSSCWCLSFWKQKQESVNVLVQTSQTWHHLLVCENVWLSLAHWNKCSGSWCSHLTNCVFGQSSPCLANKQRWVI